MIIVLAVGGVVLAAAHAEESKIREYRVKAAFMYNFAKFVEWPDGTFANTHNSINLCVFGDDVFSGVLERVSVGKTAQGRKLVIKQLNVAEEIESCQILFIGAMRHNRVVEILNSLEGSSVLTVGEMDKFMEAGGIINLIIEEGRYGFEINLKAANNAGLKVSSKLLKLAKAVMK